MTFETDLAAAQTPDAAWLALQQLVQSTVGAKLFTIMTIDMQAMLARRAYSSDPVNYPAAGTKPITPNRWLDHVHGQGQTFVANTLAEIDTVFPDAELIGKLGCGSVINLPIRDEGKLVATMNILHEEQHYTPDRVTVTEETLAGPAQAAYVKARSLGRLL
ncbi:GAF domain-containing protein [Mameliella sediminis]|uniref:GAF domain-containing protein n=1 Tax=Mameliella sediminis TaxID=2836866 RepID=UPI001C471257|nr:GAF domain-containing protein [Mameliella sediminis]MBV7397284.1 GAF domain-containing protein [Mameliella sediminis]